MKKQKGQVALIVLLIMIVILTLGVSVVQRSLFDVKLSQLEEGSNRAFQAAETGVEIALKNLAGGSDSLGDGLSYIVNVEESGGDGLVTSQIVNVGEAVSIGLENASNGLTGVRIYFIEEAQDCDEDPSAIDLTVLDEVGGGIVVRRRPFDVINRSNGFEITSQGNYNYLGKRFCARTRVVSVFSYSVEIRVRPVYVGSVIGISPWPPSASFGSQLRVIRSEGVLESSSKRAIEVERYNPQTPSVFDHAVFSSGNLVK